MKSGITLYFWCFIVVLNAISLKAQSDINYLRNIEYSEPVRLNDNVNSKEDEHWPVISPDGKTLYYTRYQDNSTYVYVAKYQNDVWQIGEPLFPDATPADNFSIICNPNENTLVLWDSYGRNMTANYIYRTKKGWSEPSKYFSYLVGGKDAFNIFIGNDLQTAVLEMYGNLFVSVLQDGGKWSKAIPLGDKINTSSREEVCCLAADNRTLYFSSQGHKGFGDNDIFMTRRLDDTWQNWSDPINMGPVINTAGKEEGIYVSAIGEDAYFVRDNDIYKVKLPEELRPLPTTIIKGTLTDGVTGLPIQTYIIYRDMVSDVMTGITIADHNGNFEIVLPSGDNYTFYGEKDGYYPLSENLDLSRSERYEELKINLKLYPVKRNKPIPLNSLFFAENSAILQKESYAELNRLVDLLKTYPKVVIRIDGHTDSDGTETHNQTLSENRAKAVYNYIIEQGIPADRLSSKGFGETLPIADNDTEEGKKMNRRVEFMVISL